MASFNRTSKGQRIAAFYTLQLLERRGRLAAGVGIGFGNPEAKPTDHAIKVAPPSARAGLAGGKAAISTRAVRACFPLLAWCWEP